MWQPSLYHPHHPEISCLVLHWPHLISAATDGTVLFWHAADEDPRPGENGGRHDAVVTCVHVCANNDNCELEVYSGDMSGCIRLSARTTEQDQEESSSRQKGQLEDKSRLWVQVDREVEVPVRMMKSTEGYLFVAAGMNVHQYRQKSRVEVRVYSHHTEIRHISLLRLALQDSTTLGVAGSEEVTCLFTAGVSLSTGVELKRWDNVCKMETDLEHEWDAELHAMSYEGVRGEIRSVISEEGHIITGDDRGKLKIWDSRTHTEVLSVSPKWSEDILTGVFMTKLVIPSLRPLWPAKSNLAEIIGKMHVIGSSYHGTMVTSKEVVSVEVAFMEVAFMEA